MHYFAPFMDVSWALVTSCEAAVIICVVYFVWIFSLLYLFDPLYVINTMISSNSSKYSDEKQRKEAKTYYGFKPTERNNRLVTAIKEEVGDYKPPWWYNSHIGSCVTLGKHWKLPYERIEIEMEDTMFSIDWYPYRPPPNSCATTLDEREHDSSHSPENEHIAAVGVIKTSMADNNHNYDSKQHASIVQDDSKGSNYDYKLSYGTDSNLNINSNNSNNNSNNNRNKNSHSKGDDEGKKTNIIVLFPGLALSSDHPFAGTFAVYAAQDNFFTAVVNYRGVERPLKSGKFWHPGDHDDALMVVDYMHHTYHATARIFLAGFSAGTNILQKTLVHLNNRCKDKDNQQELANPNAYTSTADDDAAATTAATSTADATAASTAPSATAATAAGCVQPTQSELFQSTPSGQPTAAIDHSASSHRLSASQGDDRNLNSFNPKQATTSAGDGDNDGDNDGDDELIWADVDSDEGSEYISGLKKMQQFREKDSSMRKRDAIVRSKSVNNTTGLVQPTTAATSTVVTGDDEDDDKAAPAVTRGSQNKLKTRTRRSLTSSVSLGQLFGFLGASDASGAARSVSVGHKTNPVSQTPSSSSSTLTAPAVEKQETKAATAPTTAAGEEKGTEYSAATIKSSSQPTKSKLESNEENTTNTKQSKSINNINNEEHTEGSEGPEGSEVLQHDEIIFNHSSCVVADASTIAGAFCCCVSYDYLGTRSRMEESLVGSIYSRMLAHLFKGIVNKNAHVHDEFPGGKKAISKIMSDITYLSDYDKKLGGHLHGYSSADHLIDECTMADKIDEITVPLVALQPKDDPLQAGHVRENACVDKLLTNHNIIYIEPQEGNHFGFMEGPLIKAFSCGRTYSYPARVATTFFKQLIVEEGIDSDAAAAVTAV